jgi:tetratricopeptide (TPR) repeat protein
MTMFDRAGHALSGASTDALEAFEQACHETHCLIADPVASVDRALAAAPEMTMAHVLKAYLHLLGTEPAGIAVAQDCCAAAAELAADERERGHVEAAGLLAAGRWHDAGRALEDLAVRHPRDVLALQVGHQIDFFTGDSRMLRDRIARALPAWQRGMPGHHAVLAMHAFGLEETGDYEQAERQGRLAVEYEPRDGWAWHAVTHAMEMQQRPREGIEWLQPNAAIWSKDSFFAGHNWWHLALFHLELDDIDEVLRLYDTAIGGLGSGVVLDMIDQSAMLWRLQLRGVDAGDRWAALAERWTPHAAAGNYGFNGFHAMMAFVGAGRRGEQQQVLAAQHEAMQRGDDNAGFTREVAHPATQAVLAFGEGDYAQAVRLLRPIRSRAHRFGGSHAQRDVLDLMLIEAALRGGDKALAAALAAERAAVRPRSPLSRGFVARAATMS